MLMFCPDVMVRKAVAIALCDKNENLNDSSRYYQSITTENPDGDQSIK